MTEMQKPGNGVKRGPAAAVEVGARPGRTGPAAREIDEMRRRALLAEREAQSAKARLDHLLSASSGVILSCRAAADHGATFVSPSVKSLLGYEPDEFLKEPKFWLEAVHPEDREEVEAMLAYVCEVGNLVHDFRMRHRDGGYRWLRDELRLAVPPEGRKPGEIAAYWIDITESRSLEEQYVHDAFHDPLTNLPNRALFEDRLRVSFARGRRRKSSTFAVLYVDLDRFKNVNESLGHAKGDRLLVAASKRLLKCVRFGDTVARLGGDEFLIILEDLKDRADVEATAGRIQTEIGQPYDLGGETEAFASVSIGIAIAHPGLERPEHLVRDAETAMFRAKTSGRACHVIFDGAMRDKAVSVLQLETDLRRAVERNEFVIHYQPICRLKDGTVAAFEALIRWRHPSRGLILPGHFIPQAEETGLIVPMGEWVLREACRQMRTWQGAFAEIPPLGISVNLSSKQLLPGFTGRVRDILAETGLDPASLKLEITESSIIDDHDWATGLFAELRNMKVRVLIDDFGTGYSSMNYLSKLSIDGLKIDRSFIGAMRSTGEGLEIVRMILALARNLGLNVVAEGVETAEQMEYLRWLNGEFAQGFFFSKALDAAAAERLLAARPDRGRASVSRD
jgi:diguanylate cyclase (GGDEF)-like protein/PAS domain S-box-containing protein